MLCHTAFDRAAQVARHWASRGCPVVIHVDKRVEEKDYARFVAMLSDIPEIKFSARHVCEWGTWGIVAATQEASQLMLSEFADVGHVYLASGSCLPLRPIHDLHDYLRANPQVDYIESVTTQDVGWTVGGALLQKSGIVRTRPFPLLVHATRLISAVPSALKRFISATRIWTSAVWRSGSRDAMRSPNALRHFIFASIRLRA